jgi:hypothetical protein
VVVAVIPVRVMQVAFDEIVDVIAVRHGLMAASRAMHVRMVMPAALMLRRAPIRIGCRHLDDVLVDMVLVHVMEVTVVEVVDVIAVPDGCMSARKAVLMRMVGVLSASAHRDTSGCMRRTLPARSAPPDC